MIVIGYQGIGKSTLARKQFKYIDLESSALRKHGVRWHNWYEPYCMIAEWLSRQGYVVFVSSHKEVRDYLNEFCEEPFCAVVPSENLKDEWINKLRERCEQLPTDKNYRAYMNAVDRYTENVREIKKDVEDVREIKSMSYELDKLIEKADIPQTERIKTLDYCDICNHKGCDNCISNSLDDYCVPSGYVPKDIPQTDLLVKIPQKSRESHEIDTPQTNIPKNTLRTDCTGCRFIGSYDTEFPCANCIRKNKDYYDAEQTDVYDYKGNGKWERNE